MMLRSLVVLLGIAFTLVAAGSIVKADDHSNIGFDSHFFGSDVEAAAKAERAAAASARGAETAAYYYANPYTYARVPSCLGNSPSGGGDALCETATAACPPGQVMYWFYRAPEGTAFGSPGWEQTGQRCITPPAPGEPPVVVPGLTLEDFQRLPLPAGTTNIQPDNGYTLINVPTNVYADARPVTLDTDLLGFAVQVRATPTTYTWDFGDDTTLGPTHDPGAAYPDLRTTHTYDAPGPYAVTLTTAYTGEYSVDGGPWLPVPGQAQVTSTPVPVQALSGRNNLVADPAG